MQKLNTTSTIMKPSKKTLPSFLLSASAATSLLFAMSSAQAATYSSTVLGDNPVAYYRLEELPGATTAADATANAFNAIYTYDLDTNSIPDYPLLGLPGIDTNSILVRLYTDSLSVVHHG